MMLMELGRRNKWRTQVCLCLQMDVKSVLTSSKLGWLQLLTYAILVPCSTGKAEPYTVLGEQHPCCGAAAKLQEGLWGGWTPAHPTAPTAIQIIHTLQHLPCVTSSTC